MPIQTPPASEILCRRIRGGKKSWWQAQHPKYVSISGAGNTADNAIKDYQEQFRRSQLLQHRNEVDDWLTIKS